MGGNFRLGPRSGFSDEKTANKYRIDGGIQSPTNWVETWVASVPCQSCLDGRVTNERRCLNCDRAPNDDAIFASSVLPE